jgi:magnesium-transporting ATPase (P-type)
VAAIADAGLAEVDTSPAVGQVPFSSRRRWSALDLGDVRLVLGAPERFAASDPELVERARGEASAGRRVLALGRFETPLQAGPDPRFPEHVQALGLVVLAERLRPNAADTVAFFATQGVELKVLSGDAPATVVVCGLAVVMRLEGERGRRRLAVAALCTAMALLFALALIVPFLRDFYELATPTGEAVAAWAVGVALGVGGMLGALRLRQRTSAL